MQVLKRDQSDARGSAQPAAANVAARLAPYDLAGANHVEIAASDPAEVSPELVERAATLLGVMPRNQHRKTIEELVSPNDPERGRRVVDALIDSAFAAEDLHGHLRRLG